jgi:DNA-binding response OmpR family regulator
MLKKILIVEDETTLLEVLEKKFTKEKFQVLLAKNGLEGLDIALSEHPDMILLDIVMPVMDGLTMLEKLRQDSWGRNAHVILLTNLADTDQVASATNLRVFDYLVKSNWKIEDVVKKVKEKI